MKLTTASLLSLAESGLSDTAFRIYVTAHARIAETGIQELTNVALVNLPGMPRNAKALGKGLVGLIERGLVISDANGYLFPIPEAQAELERLEANAEALASKRAEAGRKGGLRSAEARLEAFGSKQPRSKPIAIASKQTPSKPEAIATDPSLSPAPPLPAQQDPKSGISGSFPEDSSVLSSGSQGPESKRARGRTRPRTAVPDQIEPTEKHLQLASERQLDLVLETERFLAFHRAKGSLMASWPAALTTWLLSPYAKPTQPPGGSNFERLRARAERLEREEKNAAQ